MIAAKIINTEYLIVITNWIEIYLSIKSLPWLPPFEIKQIPREIREHNKNVPQSNHSKIELTYESSDKKGLLTIVSKKVKPKK